MVWRPNFDLLCNPIGGGVHCISGLTKLLVHNRFVDIVIEMLVLLYVLFTFTNRTVL